MHPSLIPYTRPAIEDYISIWRCRNKSVSLWFIADDVLAYICDYFDVERGAVVTTLFALYQEDYNGEPVTYSHELLQDLISAISDEDTEHIREEILKLIKLNAVHEIYDTAAILRDHKLKYEAPSFRDWFISSMTKKQSSESDDDE